MSVSGIVAKTIVKMTNGVVQIFGIFGEGLSKLSTKVGDNLVELDKKIDKKFETKETK